MARGRLRRAQEHENQERWLLTYSDMITLLKALHEAFSGQILPGGKQLQQTGLSSAPKRTLEQSAATTIVPFSVEAPLEKVSESRQASASGATEEQLNFERIAREVNAYIVAHHLQSQA